MSEEEYNYDEDAYDYGYDDWQEDPLQSHKSKDKPYNVYNLEEIAKKIY